MRTRLYLLWSACFIALGIAAQGWWEVPVFGAALAGAVFLAAAAVCTEKKWSKAAFLAGAFFWFAAGMVRMGLDLAIWESQSQYIVGHEANYTAVVSEPALAVSGPDGYVRYAADLRETAFSDGEKKSLSGTVYVYAPEGAPIYRTGDRIAVSGKVRPIRLYQNPGKMDLDGRYKSKRLIGRIYTEDVSDVKYLGPSGEYRLVAMAETIRGDLKTEFSPYMDAARLPVMMSLLFGGNYDDISEEIIQDFSATGVLHILSVSGSHMALLFGFLVLLGKWLRLPQKMVLPTSIGLVLFYALMAGMVPPVIRSAVMAILSVMGVFFHREKESLNLLGVAVTGMLLWNPFFLYDVSFQLSVGASAGILLFYSPLSARLCRFSWIPQWIREGSALTFSAQILTVPVVLYDFHALPLYSAPANLLVTPLLEWVIIAGLLASLVAGLAAPLGGGILQGADYLLWAGLHLNEWIAQWPSSRLPMRGMTITEMAFYYGLIAAALTRGYWGRERIRRAAVGCLLGGLFFCTAWGWWNRPAAVCYVPDLGASRGAVFLAGGKRILYYRDSGLPIDMGKRELQSFLEYEGIFAADILIMDIRGLTEPSPFTLAVPVKEIWFTGGQYRRICDTLLQEHSGQVREIRPGKLAVGDQLAAAFGNGGWYISGNGFGLYLDGGGLLLPEFSSLRQPHTAWVGGEEHFKTAVREDVMQSLRPEAAVYAGQGTPFSGEDQDLLRLFGLEPADTRRVGMTTLSWNGETWQTAVMKGNVSW